MGVTVNARFLTQPLSGVQRYAGELLDALDKRLTNDPDLRRRIGTVTAYRPTAGTFREPDWHTIKLRELAGGAGHFWEQTALAKAARGTVLLSLCGSGPVFHHEQVLVIHDANIFTVPSTFPLSYRLLHKTLRPRLARSVKAVASVSKMAAETLAPFLGVASESIHVLPNSAEHILRVRADQTILDRLGMHPGGYFLAVGNQSPNKNIERLIEAHSLVPTMPLVIAGGAAPGVKSVRVDMSVRTQVIGRVSDEELRGLYAGAAAFVWPALSEGFGIPPLEAMTLGIPVLSSSTTAMPEVLGDAALYFDPLDVQDIARAMMRVGAMTESDRKAMVTKGHERTSYYRWTATADRLASLVLDLGARA